MTIDGGKWYIFVWQWKFYSYRRLWVRAQPEPPPMLVEVWKSKRLFCHADLYTVSRCYTRGEYEDHTGQRAPKNDPAWLWDPGQKSRNRGISGPTKRSYVLQNFLKKVYLCWTGHQSPNKKDSNIQNFFKEKKVYLSWTFHLTSLPYASVWYGCHHLIILLHLPVQFFSTLLFCALTCVIFYFIWTCSSIFTGKSIALIHICGGQKTKIIEVENKKYVDWLGLKENTDPAHMS